MTASGHETALSTFGVSQRAEPIEFDFVQPVGIEPQAYDGQEREEPKAKKLSPKCSDLSKSHDQVIC